MQSEVKDPLIRLVNVARQTIEEIADGPFDLERKLEWLKHLAGKAQIEISVAERKFRASTVSNRG